MTTFRHALILVPAALLLTGAKPADSLRATFADPGAEYRPVPFWHLNGRLSSDEIVRQIIADTPLAKLAKERMRPRRQLKAWEIVLGALPDFFRQFPISLPLSFFLLFFFGTIIGGSQAVVALCMPIAMTAIPDEGLPFLAMLMGAVWAAMELSPTHVCAFVAADYYHTTFADLVAKALPSVILFSALCYGYGRLLMFLF